MQELDLLFERWPARGVEKRQLGAQKTNAFCPLLQTLDCFRDRRRVGEYRDAMTVRGHGRLVATAARLVARKTPAESLLISSLDTRRIRPADDHAAVAVDHDLFSVFDAKQLRADSDDHRHAERSRDDGGMSRDTSIDKCGAAG